MTLSFPTVCVASGCCLQCIYYGLKDTDCKFIKHAPLDAAQFPLADDASENISRNTDYSANILFVLAFIHNGDGGTEAARLLGLLGLPNNTTMQSDLSAILNGLLVLL